MKKKRTNYILAFAIVLCLILSLAIFVTANISTKAMLYNKVNYSYSQIYIFAKNIFALLLIMGLITAILVFLLTKRIFVERSSIKCNTIDRRLELELKDKTMELENMVKGLKEKEEKLEYDKLKTDFFANISHEFKTPLNILMGAMQLLELYTTNGTIVDPNLKLHKYLEIMKQNALRLLRLINNIIDLTKIDSSYFYVELHNYDIVELTEGIIQSINLYAKVKSVNIIFEKKIKKQVMAFDADKIERILLNLLSNALKFTDKNGNIEVEIGTHEEKSVYISIKDDGIGIQEDKLEVIFHRFRQVDKSFTRNREGSGIGLSLVKSLVEMHKGTVVVKSEYGKGSEFIVELPIITINEEAQTKMYSEYEDSRLERVKVEFSDI
ncbi:HAMP domain-containing histidine kinase [Clostridium bowmanii]|uniref:sensor histidine kinase n=1 Tax=Clostridium bowmanii TaxID=132925 RepID=UPI001C0BC601|nr:HAMP domain-containing sensor histidine kinase [Clostridium bowmanii]MBU3188837.1 HAMP domain-containing histidine kinase [Clostridium bowmanii]MCA1073757.1 HAMP domain-containing histidine kinase [Clostridium bowmanii]